MNTILNRFSEHFFKYLIIILTAIAGVCIFVFFQCFNQIELKDRFELFLGIIILYTGLCVNLINYKIAHNQFFKSLFTEFNNRFDKLNEGLNAIKRKELNENLDNAEIAIIIDYINLCAEEYLWYKKGMIHSDVWTSWRKGMDYYLKHENFKGTVDAKAREEYESYYGLFDELGIGRMS